MRIIIGRPWSVSILESAFEKMTWSSVVAGRWSSATHPMNESSVQYAHTWNFRSIRSTVNLQMRCD